MKIQKKKEDIFNSNFLNKGEFIANKYALKSGTTAFVIITIIWILNLLKVFYIDATIMRNCYLACVFIYVVGVVVCAISDLSKHWVKYFLMLWIVVFVTILNTCLTFHAVITYLLAIVYTAMYSSRKMMVYASILTICSIIVSVYGGCYFGVVDENMLQLSARELAIFFIFPRSMICVAFAVVCSRVIKIINLNVQYAQKMEDLAEKDGMTLLYNKSKYLEMISTAYLQEEKIGVIYWDINYLKKLNDTMGHEDGDKLILTVAESIRKVCNASDDAYRIGGDEFVMIMRGADEKMVAKKIREWKQVLKELGRNSEYPISVSVGYAYGEGKNLDIIIREADRKMYENKRLIHNSLLNN